MPRHAAIRVAAERRHRGARDRPLARSQSPEAILWTDLRDERMLGYSFERGCAVDRHGVAFYCKKLRLAIDVERIVRRNARAVRAGERRSARLMQLGITLLRFSDEEIVHNPDGVVGSIRHWIRSQPFRWGGTLAPARAVASIDPRATKRPIR